MLRSLRRIFSFFYQWMAEVFRQPWLMISLIVGPFLILFIFGEGEAIGAPRPRAVIVLPAGQNDVSDLGVTPQDLSQYLQVVATTTDEQQARADLVRGNADLVVVIPSNAAQT